MSGQVLGTPVIDQFYMSGKASIIGMGGAKIGHDCRYGGGGQSDYSACPCITDHSYSFGQ